jgi:hypothetical protein
VFEGEKNMGIIWKKYGNDRGHYVYVDKMRWVGGPKRAHFCLNLG